MPKKISLVLILLAVVIFNLLRFWKLDSIPNGYHVDEVGSAVTMQCFVERGCDAELTPHPLFGFMEYGQDKPPTWIYPGIIWVKIFGSSVPSLRAYSVFGLTMGIVGLFFLGRSIFGSGFALAVVLTATCSPWSWVVTRVALESYFAPVFAIWGLYFFWRSSTKNVIPAKAGIQNWEWALAAFLWACAMYTYPPARMQIPLLMVTLGLYEWRRRPLVQSSFLSLTVVFIASLLPLVRGYLPGGTLSRRFADISISNQDYLHSLGLAGTPVDVFKIFIHNYLLHLSPDFLFFRGDPSFVHSTRHLGILSFLDTGALVILAVFIFLAFQRRAWRENPVAKNRRWLMFLAANFFIGIIPSALTNQELPHALRICGSWPFMMMFTGFMWWSAAECLKALWPVLALAGILSGGVLVYQYFALYPQESKGMFDYWIKDTAEQLETQGDWQKFLFYFHRQNYHCMYFLVHRLHLTCKEAHDLWWQIHGQLEKQGKF